MGTSTHNSGQKGGTPLVPSWLIQSDDAAQTDSNIKTSEILANPQLGNVNRFTAPRGEFTRYINSGGRSMGYAKRSISNYVRHSLGGSVNATHRLGSALNSSIRFWNIASSFATGGAKNLESLLKIDNLSAKTAGEVLLAIVDFVCPDGGLQDEGIARTAYIAAIEEAPELLDISFDQMNPSQLLIIVKKSMANVILGRIANDIGNKIIMLPSNPDEADELFTHMRDYIYGSISDAVVNLGINDKNFSQENSEKIVNEVYKATFDILAEAGEDE